MADNRLDRQAQAFLAGHMDSVSESDALADEDIRGVALDAAIRTLGADHTTSEYLGAAQAFYAFLTGASPDKGAS